jgi:hypothetical protein
MIQFRRSVLAVPVGWLCCLVLAPGGASAAAPPRAELRWAPWQDEKAAGPNCLYALLRLQGRDVSHAELVEAAACERRVTLVSLQREARRRGAYTRVAALDPASVEQFPLPAIAHLVSGSDDNFVLVCAVAGDRVTFLDGTTGQVKRVTRSQFASQWTGYALVPYDPWWPALRPMLYGLPAVGLVLLFWGWPRSRSLRRARRAAPRQPAAPAAVPSPPGPVFSPRE